MALLDRIGDHTAEDLSQDVQAWMQRGAEWIQELLGARSIQELLRGNRLKITLEVERKEEP